MHMIKKKKKKWIPTAVILCILTDIFLLCQRVSLKSKSILFPLVTWVKSSLALYIHFIIQYWDN